MSKEVSTGSKSLSLLGEDRVRVLDGVENSDRFTLKA
jgi:hypothetical protein